MGRRSSVATVVTTGVSSPSSSTETSFRELDDVFLQTQTRIWLGEVLKIRLDEQLNLSDLLADGELLIAGGYEIEKYTLAALDRIKSVVCQLRPMKGEMLTEELNSPLISFPLMAKTVFELFLKTLIFPIASVKLIKLTMEGVSSLCSVSNIF